MCGDGGVLSRLGSLYILEDLRQAERLRPGYGKSYESVREGISFFMNQNNKLSIQTFISLHDEVVCY